MSVPQFWGSEQQTNIVVSADQLAPRVVALQGGFTCVVWHSTDTGDGNGTVVRASILMPNGTPLGGEQIVNSTTSGDQALPRVTMLPDGRIVAVWQSSDAQGSDLDGGCIRGRIFGSDGAPIGSDFVINTTTANAQIRPDIAVRADGGFLVTWESQDGSNAPEIRGRLFLASGTPVANDFVVNSTTSGMQTSPAVTALQNGGFLVAWESTDDGDGDFGCIRGRVVNADGTLGAADFVLNTTATGAQQMVQLDTLSDGRVVAVWMSEGTFGPEYETIRATFVNADGTPSGADYLVSAAGTGGHFHPSVSAVPGTTRFMVTWQMLFGDADDASVEGRLFTGALSGGSLVTASDQFTVNTTTEGSQGSPAVTVMSDGRILVSWVSMDSGEVGTIPGDPPSGSLLHHQIIDPRNGVQLGRAETTVLDTSGAPTDVDATVAGILQNGVKMGGDDHHFVVASNGGFDVVMFEGYGIQYVEGTNHVIAGTITNITVVVGGEVFAVTNNMTMTAVEVDGAIDALQDPTPDPAPYELIQSRFAYAFVGAGGNDYFEGDRYGDLVFGLAGNDTFYGLAGSDTVDGGTGSDTVYGGNGADSLIGADGNDRLIGDNGNDTVNGGVGNDWLYGGGNNDRLYGDAGNDRLFGQSNSDVLLGGYGNDTLTGGAGVDYFVFDTALNATWNIDTIADYTVADDTIQLDNAIFTAFGTYTGPVWVAAFYTGTAAHDASDRIIYDNTTGAVFYDPDGTGAQAQVQFATLTPGLSLTSSEFRIV